MNDFSLTVLHRFLDQTRQHLQLTAEQPCRQSALPFAERRSGARLMAINGGHQQASHSGLSA